MQVRSSTSLRGQLETQHTALGEIVAGVDEVGRGCLAGPVHAACVILDYSRLFALPASCRDLIRDSKKLSAEQRASLIPVIKDIALAYGVASASPRIIERIGIAPATFTAMRKAIRKCEQSFDTLFVDGKCKVDGYHGRQITVVKGDDLCFCIAAASILAKEARDTYMRSQSKAFPAYGFERHVGYGTKYHLDMIKLHGVCDLHRRNFSPVTEYLELTGTQTELFC